MVNCRHLASGGFIPRYQNVALARAINSHAQRHAFHCSSNPAARATTASDADREIIASVPAAFAAKMMEPGAASLLRLLATSAQASTPYFTTGLVDSRLFAQFEYREHPASASEKQAGKPQRELSASVAILAASGILATQAFVQFASR